MAVLEGVAENVGEFDDVEFSLRNVSGRIHSKNVVVFGLKASLPSLDELNTNVRMTGQILIEADFQSAWSPFL